MIKKPELLAPAGNLEKMKMALLYGADAVYLGGKAFGLRAFGGNFTYEELKEASRQGLIDKKVYALGGMNLGNIKVARDLGFGGVVICGDLWNRFDIHNELDYKELLLHFEHLKKAID